MRRFFNWLKNLFFPPAEASNWRKVLPFGILGGLTILVLISGTFAWEYTNSNVFCGTVCHTMPPQFSTYLKSSHAGVNCVDCHLGRAPFFTQLVRKVEDGTLTFTSLVTNRFVFPLRAHNMRPANEACETCHYPAKFSWDTLRVIEKYAGDEENSQSSIYLILKTGGGTSREGLGFGIHWHIENPMYFYTVDEAEQIIPYVRVNNSDGTVSEYIDINSDFKQTEEMEAELKTVDCITCHNRTSHQIYQPEQAVDQLLERELISAEIPNIRSNAVAALKWQYVSTEQAAEGITYLATFYQETYPDFYAENASLVESAIERLQETYVISVFPEQGMNWDSHPDNIGHEFSAGCFRCHDGNHINQEGDTIRLECNICHSIPVVSTADEFVTDIEISKGPEPESHFNPNWITLHRDVFDVTCENCHTIEDPGGVSDTSFCSNSACHSNPWVYAGFDAPALRQLLEPQLEEMTTAAVINLDDQPLTYSGVVGELLAAQCSACHAEGGIQGLNLTSYEELMAGSDSGPVIVPGDPDNSLLITKISGSEPHFGSFSDDELNVISDWISAGAPLE